jgi:hypothetical protein
MSLGTRTNTSDKLFIGWFGPRGSATIVFAVLVFDEKLPGNDTIILAAGWTVLLSVVAHGITANPLVKAMAGGRGARRSYVPRRTSMPWLRGSRIDLGALPSGSNTRRWGFAPTSGPSLAAPRPIRF